MPDPLDPTRLDLLLVFTGKANLNASSQAQVTRGGFFQVIAVDLFTKYSALGLDDVADLGWVDDTVLNVWISCFCIGVIGVCIVNYETGELLHSVAGSLQFAAGRYTCIAGVLRWHHWQEWFVSHTGHFILKGVEDPPWSVTRGMNRATCVVSNHVTILTLQHLSAKKHRFGRSARALKL